MTSTIQKAVKRTLIVLTTLTLAAAGLAHAEHTTPPITTQCGCEPIIWK